MLPLTPSHAREPYAGWLPALSQRHTRLTGQMNERMRLISVVTEERGFMPPDAVHVVVPSLYRPIIQA
jgi:hypothetical protein